jgi:hypothetical protein
MIRRSRSLTTTVVTALAFIGGAVLSPLNAQALPRSFASLSYAPAGNIAAPHLVRLELDDSTRRIPKTYWMEGALIGGTVAGIFLASLAGGLCSDADSGGGNEPCWDNLLLGAAIGFGIGGSLGALIGGQFKRPSKDRNNVDQPAEPTAQDSTVVAPAEPARP